MPVMTFKVTASEAKTIRARARAAKAPSVSAFIRGAVLGASSNLTIDRKPHPISGLPYNASPGRTATVEEIQSALGDFP
jgi:hypothetical protein